MAKLIYLTNVSIDGYIEDERGTFAWLPRADTRHQNSWRY